MTDDDVKNQLAALAAHADQAKGGFREIASVLGVFFRELVANGFDRPEALILVQTQLTLMNAQSQNGEDQ